MRAELGAVKAELGGVKAELGAVKAELATAWAENVALRAQVNRNSGNSSNPPSTDMDRNRQPKGKPAWYG